MSKLIYLLGFFCIEEKCISMNSMFDTLEECKNRANKAIQVIREQEEFGYIVCIDRTRFEKKAGQIELEEQRNIYH